MNKLKKTLTLLAALAIFLTSIQSSFALSSWTKLTNGVNKPSDTVPIAADVKDASISCFKVFDSKLYIGTRADGGSGDGAEVWEWDGTTMTVITPIDFDGSGGGGTFDNADIADMEEYDSKLYASVFKSGTPAKIYRWDGGTTWVTVRTGSINAGYLPSGFAGYQLETYGSDLYYGEDDQSNGSNFYSYDGSSFTELNMVGFGQAENYGVMSMKVYDGNLYIGTHHAWQDSRVYKYNGSTFTQIFDASSNNSSIEVRSMTTDSSYLYWGTYNDSGGEGSVYRYDGATYTEIGNDLGSTNDNAGIDSLTVLDSKLYAGTYNWSGTAQVFEYSGGSWTKVNTDGFGTGGGANNHTWALAAFDGEIFAGTGWGSGGAEVWYANNPSADLELTKTVDNATPTTVESVTYTLTLTNNGPDSATDVGIRDVVPVGLTYSSSNAAQGTYLDFMDLWDVGTVANGVTTTLTITAAVTASAGTVITNTAEVANANEGDPDSTVNNGVLAEDDQDSVDITVIAATSADLTVTEMTVDNQNPITGGTVTYTLKVKNNGPDDATNIQVTNTLPSGFSYGNSAPTQGTFLTSTGLWAVGGLVSGSEATLMFDAVVGASAGTTFTNSVEVTSVTEADPDSTPNNAVTTEDDYGSVQGTVAAAATGGSNYTPSGGGSSSTKDKLSGEEAEEKAEEPEEEPEEVIEEEIVEEEVVEEEPAPSEELPTDTVIEAVVEPIYEYFVEPTPPAPPAYQPPPTPPAPAPPVQEGLLDEAMVSNAIDLYLQEPIPEPKEKSEYDPETAGSDVDGDRLSDAFAAANGLPLGEIDPDGDSYSNEKEIYCGTNPLVSDELNPKVSNLERVTSGSTPAFRLCAETPGDSYEIYLVDQESDEQLLLGNTTIGDDNRGVFVPGTPIPDGSYYILAKNADEEELHVSSFTVSDSDAPTAPGIQLVAGTGGGSDLGRTVRLVIEFNGDIYTFDSERFIASASTQAFIKGSSGPRLIAYATWQSRILGSVVISDASTGEFELEIPSDLPPGEHEILVYVTDEENNLVSSVTSFIFTR
jgi:uncharacterized repeat protein (TIGR01451 family)